MKNLVFALTLFSATLNASNLSSFISGGIPISGDIGVSSTKLTRDGVTRIEYGNKPYGGESVIVFRDTGGYARLRIDGSTTSVLGDFNIANAFHSAGGNIQMGNNLSKVSIDDNGIFQVYGDNLIIKRRLDAEGYPSVFEMTPDGADFDADAISIHHGLGSRIEIDKEAHPKIRLASSDIMLDTPNWHMGGTGIQSWNVPITNLGSGTSVTLNTNVPFQRFMSSGGFDFQSDTFVTNGRMKRTSVMLQNLSGSPVPVTFPSDWHWLSDTPTSVTDSDTGIDLLLTLYYQDGEVWVKQEGNIH